MQFLGKTQEQGIWLAGRRPLTNHSIVKARCWTLLALLSAHFVSANADNDLPAAANESYGQLNAADAAMLERLRGVVSAGPQAETAATLDIDSIKDAELPKKVELTESVQLRITSGPGAPGVTTLPKGVSVDVTGRKGNMLQILFVKSAGQIDISKTTALAEVVKKRAEELQASRARGAALLAEAERLDREREMEESQKRDILVHSWTVRQTSSGSYIEAVGEIENESGRVLEKVQAEIITRDASGTIVSTDTAMVSDRDLRPGQRTTFKAMIRRVGGEQKASLSFRKFWGERYTHREK
jgi:hypothetical protein